MEGTTAVVDVGVPVVPGEHFGRFFMGEGALEVGVLEASEVMVCSARSVVDTGLFLSRRSMNFLACRRHLDLVPLCICVPIEVMAKLAQTKKGRHKREEVKGKPLISVI